MDSLFIFSVKPLATFYKSKKGVFIQVRPDIDSEGTTQIQLALARILNSPEFENAIRLKGLLSYIVTETCKGRGELILGKTIAQDVYARGADADGKGLSLVKVDAGRLRRRLVDYYTGTGSGETMRIVIHRGGYVPSFENTGLAGVEPEKLAVIAPVTTGKRIGSLGALVGLFTIGAVVLTGLFWLVQGQAGNLKSTNTDTQIAAERHAVLAKSPSALQAANLANQARALIFPPTDPIRLQATLDMFKRAIDLDPAFFGGYAGASQIVGMQASLSSSEEGRKALLATAKTHADRAVALRPDASWSQSASAWVLFVARDFEAANKTSKLSVALDPDDFDALDFDGLIALFSGEFERALQSADPARHKMRVGSRFNYRNTYAVASFHLGRYDDTIRFFSEAAAQGDPVGQISIAYLAAAHYKLGNTKQAEKLVRDFDKTWPNARLDLLLSRAFKSQEYVDEVMDPFKSAGWSPL